LHGLRHVTVPGAFAAIGLQQAQGDFFTEQGFEVEMRVGRDAIDLEAERFRYCLAAGETFDEQGCVGEGCLEFDQAGMLIEQRIEQGGLHSGPVRAA